MSPEEVVVIDVPASTANLGPGFDSIGLALNLYLTLEVEKGERWSITMLSEELNVFPTDESNFIIATALLVAGQFGRTLPPCQIKMSSDIPLTRGLGSSAAAIIAAIELADQVGQLGLSQDQKMQVASQIERHPDNIGAALYGGLVVGTQLDEEVDVLSFKNLSFDIVMLVPKHELLTKESRGLLPGGLDYAQAVRASSVANVLVAALLQGDYKTAGKMMTKDLFHQPYRKGVVPELSKMEQLAIQSGAFGVALSGAGPSVIAFVEKGKAEEVLSRLEPHFPHAHFYSLQIDNEGSRVRKKIRK